MKATHRAPMAADARAVLERMAASLERLIEKGQPLSAGEVVLSSITMLAASQILSELDTSAMGDEVVDRLRVAVDNIESLGLENPQWVN